MRSLPSERLANYAGSREFDPAHASLRERFAMTAGALQAVARMLPAGSHHVVHFKGDWQHLGSLPISKILDLADQALDIARCDGCEPPPVYFAHRRTP